MKKGTITGKVFSKNYSQQSEYNIDFDNSKLGPYSQIFDRESLYFNETTGERGSFFFPLKEQLFNNTEIFIERNDIVIALGERGSFSGESRIFLEVVNLTNANKYRFYPEQVSLIYNARTSIVIYYKKGDTYKRLELDIKTLEKKSEISTQVSTFFKLFYNHTDKTYGRLIYKANAKSHQAGYFVEELIISDTLMPMYFLRDNFLIDTYGNEKIDVWEASLTGEL